MLDLNYIALFKGLSPEMAVFFISMIPVAELRASIPIGLTVYNLDVLPTLFYAILGDIFPMFFILYLIDPVSRFLMKHFAIFNKFFTWLFKRTRIKFEGKYAKYGSIALVLFVAIPLPITGAWTGALAAFLFRIPRQRAAILIIFGVIIAALVVTFITKTAWGAFLLLT
jgi:uncharacterized membrane protein